MNRKVALLVVIVGVGCWFAFRSYREQPTPKRPDNLSKAEIESEVRDAMKLKEVHLTETAKGEFSGSGSASDGTKCEITATQSGNKLTWQSEDAQGVKVIGSKGWSGN